MDEFTLTDGETETEMEYGGLDAAHSYYNRDYPGAFLGQCFGKGEEKSSLLVFDIKNSAHELTLKLQDKSVLLGKIVAILNPPPTETLTITPTKTKTPTPTNTPTPTATPTALPSGKLDPAKVGGTYINVRSGPGANYPVAWRLTADNAFDILGRNVDNTWLFISVSTGERGWISKAFITTDSNLDFVEVSTEIIPTITPSPTLTRTPIPTVAYAKQPPKGTWCSYNSYRTVCVGSLQYKTYLGYKSAAKNARFIVLGVGVKNIDSSDISVNPFDFTIVMEDGRTYEHSSETYYYDNAVQGVDVAPGDVAQGILVFYVPNEVGPAKIICRGGLFEENIIIDLHSKPND